ncbi:MAG: thiamine phosphate synthase, partial [Anaerotignum sp.]|nr:thiamine phosphate synthase [Anaerotignum sp.]
YAIGGISSENINAVRKVGAAGACVMSGLMRCENVKETMKGFEIKV